MNANNYLTIANSEYSFLFEENDSPYLNPFAVMSQQVVEKYLKFIVESFCLKDLEESKSVLKSHNLNTIYNMIVRNGIDLNLNRDKLAVLRGYYFELSEPGKDYYMISKEDLSKSLLFVIEVREKVFTYLRGHGVCIVCGSSLGSNGVCENMLCKCERV